MSNETYIAAYAVAGGIATAHSESAWNALLAGDLDAALAATPKFINMRTGEEIGRRAAERFWGATASAASQPSTVDSLDAMAEQVYGGDGPWGRRRACSTG